VAPIMTLPRFGPVSASSFMGHLPGQPGPLV
jgi:hypothetical protein